jgi:DNA-binding CsgD family transcriptional regulator
MLVGRTGECAGLDRLLEGVRAGRGGALALRGEPGTGKSALLAYAVEQATDVRVLVASGVPSESEIPFSALLELLRPVLAWLDELPRPQADALAGALALGPPVAGDRFAVYAATLSLLAHGADEAPVLGVIDDAQWVDASSADALLFAARRLGAERAGLLFAVHEDAAAPFEAAAVPTVAIGGLDREASTALLAQRAPDLAPAVAEQLFRATAGNPLALVEIPALLSAGQLDGSEPLDDPIPAGAGAERAFLRRIAELPDATQRALLVAATAGSAEIAAIAGAIAVRGLDAAALEAAETAGLIVVDGVRLAFRHPLVRSSVYHGAAPSDRRAAHGALAAALGESSDPHATERRAWHLAAAALAPDERVAEALDAAAAAAGERTGYAAAAAAFERAAELTPGADDQARRLLRAAEAWQLAGRSPRAVDLLDRALALAGDPLLRAAIHHLWGRIDTWRGPAAAAHERLVREAARVEPLAPERAAQMLTDAVTAFVVIGDIRGAVATAEQAYEAASRLGGTPELLAALQLGKALILHGDSVAGHPLIMRCDELADGLVHGIELAHCAPALMAVEEYEAARAVLDRLVDAARSAGAFGLLAYCLGALAELDVRTGRWTSAYAAGFEAVKLAEETGQDGQLSYNLARLARLEAAQGREDACRAHADRALELAHELGFGSSVAFAESALGLLELGLGNPEAAGDRLRECGRLVERLEMREPGRLEWEPDLVEALARAGQLEAAEVALGRFEHRAVAAQRSWAIAAAQRCRGMLAGEGFEACFEAALEWHDRTQTPFERARTQLCFGERLRRARRRSDARSQLRAAVEAFDRLGARLWAERARRELRASGQTARRRDPSTAERLTAQELQVALIVARGATNREAAAALFVSPKTIDSHLHSAYRKLGVRSRTELAERVLSRAGEGVPEPA